MNGARLLLFSLNLALLLTSCISSSRESVNRDGADVSKKQTGVARPGFSNPDEAGGGDGNAEGGVGNNNEEQLIRVTVFVRMIGNERNIRFYINANSPCSDFTSLIRQEFNIRHPIAFRILDPDSSELLYNSASDAGACADNEWFKKIRKNPTRTITVHLIRDR
jgi:hypothetical protein